MPGSTGVGERLFDETANCDPDTRHRGPTRGLPGMSAKDRILLANSKVSKWVCPTCLLGRQKRLGTCRKKEYF